MFIIIAAVIVIALIVIAVVASGKKKVNINNPSNQNTTNEQTNNSAAENNSTGENSATNTPLAASDAGAVNPALKDATVVVPGANPITKDNKVVTSDGKATVNNVSPMGPNAPQQTSALASTEKLAASVIKVSVTSSGFTPAQFSTNAGAPTTIAVTSGDKSTHILMFDSADLSAVAVGAGPGETRAITFNAPTKAGEYTFRCDIPGHAGRGEVGKMIVK